MFLFLFSMLITINAVVFSHSSLLLLTTDYVSPCRICFFFLFMFVTSNLLDTKCLGIII